MNKISHKPELHVQYINLNKTQTDSFRHHMIMKTSHLLTKQLSTSAIHPDPLPDMDCEHKSIFIKKEALERTLSVYQWRYKTCYPVIKPTKLVVKSFTGSMKQRRPLCKKNAQSPFEIWNLDQSLYELVVATQKVHYRLSEISTLPLPQLFYLLKQVLVGFECLIDIFGIFEPSEDMIAVNEQNEWRFWISEDFASNSKRESNTTEAEFILKIIKMVESRLSGSKVGAKFFEEVRNVSVKSFTFLNLLDMTNIFISFNKIIVAKKFVSGQTKNKSLYGSKNQSYFKLNRTYNELKDSNNLQDKTFNTKNTDLTSKNPNEKTWMKSHFEPYSPKNASIYKINTMKNLYDKSVYTKKQSMNLNSSNRQNQQKKQKDSKAHLKISQFFYAQTLTKNNIEKRASFLFHSGQLHAQKPKEDFLKNKTSLGQIPKNDSPTLFKLSNTHARTETCIDGPAKFRPTSPRSRKFSFENIIKTQPYLPECITHNMPTTIPTSPKQRKNNYYDYEKSNDKQEFSESPNKSSSKKISFKEERKFSFYGEKPNNMLEKNSVLTKRENVRMYQEPNIRQRKYSENGPKIKSLDEFAKKSKKMFESSTIEAAEPHKDVKYGNLKTKDIACHVRHATISGMAFGQSTKKVDKSGFNNINNDLYNGKFEEIMKSIKSKSNGDRNEERDELNDGVVANRKRRVTLFEKVREVAERKVSGQFGLQARENYEHSPCSGASNVSPKPIIRVSNANNLTAESLNMAKGSQSNSLSINNNKSNVRASDTNSNQKQHYGSQDRRGMIGQSNLSVFSCKTYQPGKEGDKRVGVADREKGMANSQDCFNDNNNESESSEEFLKSNNWNKKISGLFSEVASIKMLKESSHFGDEFELFEKEHLKEVKLEKLDKLGKELKGSIIEMEDGRHVLNVPTRGMHNKSFSLIGEVKEEPCENDPSYLEYSTSMICQSKNMEYVSESPQVQKNVKHCESFEEASELEGNGGFNFATELYKLSTNQ